MKENKNFYFLTGTFIFSVFVGTFIKLSFYLIPITFLIFLFFPFIDYLKQKRLSKKFLNTFLFIFIFCLGFFYTNYFIENKRGELDHYVNQKVDLTGVIVDEPDVRDFNTRLIFKVDGSEKTKIILKTTPYPEYKYGDIVRVSGVLKKPENFKGENGREFDYVNFLKKDNIFYAINWPKIEKVGEGGGNYVKRNLFKIKNKFLNQSKKILPEPHASFLGGLILGAKSSMGEELQDDFRKTGVIHIVVLSGFNVTIVAEFMVRIFSFLGIIFSSVFGSISIVLFALLTGASATIVRASIMALLVILARVTNRVSEVTRALFLAGSFMLLFNPMLLVYDPSFQLSFLASLGLIKLSPFIESKTLFIPKGRFDIRGLFAATLSTQIFVLPFLIWMMGEFSLVSPIVNILILIFIPIIMLLGFLMNIISFVWFELSYILSPIVFIMLDYALIVVSVFSKIPLSYIKSGSFSFYYVPLIYLGYFLVSKFYLRREPKP